MKFTIKNKKFLNRSDLVIDYIQYQDNDKISTKLIEGMLNISKIEENKTEFEYVDYRKDGYVLIKIN